MPDLADKCLQLACNSRLLMGYIFVFGEAGVCGDCINSLGEDFIIGNKYFALSRDT